MKVGAVLPQFEGWLAGETPRWSDILEIATTADQGGLDSLWLVDHLLLEPYPPFLEEVQGQGPWGAWEAWSLMAALAASTSRVELGTLVTPMRFRNPALFAKMVDVVEEVSGGRVIVGLGAGGPNAEYRAFGMAQDKFFSRFKESLELFHGLIRDGQQSYSGEFYSAEDCVLRPRGPRPNGPPILIGCRGERMLELTARHADIWNTAWINKLENLAPLMARVDAACEKVGRDPSTLGRSIAVMIDLPGSEESTEADWVVAYRRPDGPNSPISGSQEAIVEALCGYADAGVDHIQAWLSPNTAAGFEQFAHIKELVDRHIQS